MDISDPRSAMRTYARRARELGSETRGLVPVDQGVWAHARPDGTVEIWHRKPTAEERSSAVAECDAPATSLTPMRVKRKDTAEPKSPAAMRVTKFFGRAK